MTVAVSLDIETLSTHKNAVVLSIGACTVSLDKDERRKDFYCMLDVQSQIDAGRHVSFSTLAWWMRQDDAAKAVVFRDDIEKLPVTRALTALRTWLVSLGNVPVWTKGPAFDGAILESLAEDFKQPPSWAYRNHRDLRVIEEAAAMSKDDSVYESYHDAVSSARKNRVAHNALDDAIMQAAAVEWFIRRVSA